MGPFTLAWATNNAATESALLNSYGSGLCVLMVSIYLPSTERGIASGLVPGFGQFGAIVATWSYRKL